MKQQTLVEQDYWDAGYATLQPTMASADDPLRQWLEQRITRAVGDQHALEIGCYPGRYLAVLAALGYVVHGIDLTPAVARMKPAFDAMGLRTGDFAHADFLLHEPERRYDLVCSFGFIEHFRDWRGMIARHAELVAPGGLLVLETPNFRGWFQQLLHRALDATNLRRHHLDAMRPNAWAAMLRSSGFEVMEHGWMGRFDFWGDSPPPNALQRALLRALRMITPWLKRRRPGGAALSPYCVLIARKPSAAA